ncbi:hypothetical protein BC835DRAFT_1369370 [Cytidiella melzeri]|nr:hypothetical protein BC835DRAFT_1369370 [Cytidiella melzeri]
MYNGVNDWQAVPSGYQYEDTSNYYYNNNNCRAYSPPTDYLIPVPQRIYQANIQRNHTTNIGPMEFITNKGRGIRLADVLARATVGLHRADERPLQGFGTKVTYRIEWPGYDSYNKQKHALRATREKQSVCLSKIATHVAEVMQEFVKEMNGQATTDPRWRVGPEYIDFEDMYLVEVRQVAKASLQPIIAYRPKTTMDPHMVPFTPFYPPPPVHPSSYPAHLMQWS